MKPLLPGVWFFLGGGAGRPLFVMPIPRSAPGSETISELIVASSCYVACLLPAACTAYSY